MAGKSRPDRGDAQQPTEIHQKDLQGGKDGKTDGRLPATDYSDTGD